MGCLPVNRQLVRVAWYRLRATFGRRWGGYLTIVLLVGLVGGLAMGAVAGARRTQSSFTAYLASTNPSDLELPTGGGGGQSGGPVSTAVNTIAHLPHVRRIESYTSVNVLPLGPNGVPAANALAQTSGNGTGSVDGRLLDQDRATVSRGRMPNPNRADEAVISAMDARFLGFHLGEVIPLGFYTNNQTSSPDFGTASVVPKLRAAVRVVGIVVFNNEVVQDEVEGNSQYVLVFTPALTRQLLGCCANSASSGIRVDRASNVAAVAAEIQRALPGAPPAPFRSPLEAKAERAIKPEAIALGVFGGIAALSALLIAAQVIGRQLRLGADDLATLRALGADSAMTSSDGLIGVVGAVILGSMLGVAVAAALSPLAPLGPARPVVPGAGVALDWTVLGLGPLVLVIVLAAVAVTLAYREAPPRAALRQQRAGGRGSRVARAAATSGLPVPAVTGIRFALEPGAGRTAVPVRSAIIGAALAVVVVAATLTFGASLRSLVSHPALYGWNWDYMLAAGGGTGAGDVPEQQVTKLLAQDPDVRAWTGVYYGDLAIDGQRVPVLAGSPTSGVGPPILSGHAFDAPDQVVLGAVTLAQLHKRVGDTVIASNGSTEPTRLRIVGTATMPAIGGGSQHLDMGTGASLSYLLIPPARRNPFDNPVTGPNALLVRLRSGANRRAALTALNKIADATSTNANFGVSVLAVQRPAEIVNYRSMGTTPVLLGAGLAVGAVSAMGLTLIASVRRRRHDLALLKVLGFTRRQLGAVVAWQSTVAVAIGTIAGVPLGIVLGRALWDLFARQIHAVPAPSVPGLSMFLIVAGALVLANLVAAVPGRIAARTPTALLLRTQ